MCLLLWASRSACGGGRRSAHSHGVIRPLGRGIAGACGLKRYGERRVGASLELGRVWDSPSTVFGSLERPQRVCGKLIHAASLTPPSQRFRTAERARRAGVGPTGTGHSDADPVD